jgi:hypothetical protein
MYLVTCKCACMCCACVCVCVYANACLCVYAPVCTCLYVLGDMQVCLYVRVYKRVCVCVERVSCGLPVTISLCYTQESVCVCIRKVHTRFLHACMCKNACIYITYMHTCIHTNTLACIRRKIVLTTISLSPSSLRQTHSKILLLHTSRTTTFLPFLLLARRRRMHTVRKRRCP